MTAANATECFSDRLLDACERRGGPICIGIDPMLENLPEAVRQRISAEAEAGGAIEAAVDAIYDFCLTVLKTVAPHVPVVKFQSAYFEKYLWEGVQAYYHLVLQAKELGLLVIGDVKRGDISSTAAAYAAGHLEEQEVALPHAVTVNPMLGLDTLQPFVSAARRQGKGLFVLVRTSNPGSSELQDVRLADGRTWSEMLADGLNPIASAADLIGRQGYSAVGAVVGATQEHTITSLRQRLPHSIFLLPGYGAQGAKAAQTRAAFKDGRGALISASRSIIYAHAEARYASAFGNDWAKCVEQAVLDMKEDVRRTLG
jgi:orotidine-5'-phosphate decarboxylase